MQRTSNQTIRAAFKDAKAILRDIEDELEPEQRRKSKGETEAGFMDAARLLVRRVLAMPAEAYSFVSDLWDALDWTSPCFDAGDDMAGADPASSVDNFPGLHL